MAREFLKKLAAETQTLGDLYKLDHESDRAFGIIAVSILEDQVAETLRRCMVQLTKKERLDLFGPDRPLGSFGAKINLAFALGVIGQEVRADLNCIRDIRNVFAHGKRVVDFTTPEIPQAIDQLTLWKRALAGRQPWSPKLKFDQSCTMASMMMSAALE